VDPGREIFFPKGLPGFTHLHQFRLMTDPAYSPPFELLVSDEDSDVGFYLVDPTMIVRDYAPHLPSAEMIEVEAESDEDFLVRAVVTIGSDAATTTANLAAPLLLNVEKGRGCQAILEDSRYSMHTPLAPDSAV
jgi:flagellar assembly factor FliW